MIIIENFSQVAAQIETERNISKDVLISAVEQAISAAAKKKLNKDYNIEATFDEESGNIVIFRVQTVVDEIEDEENELSLAEAKKLQKGIEIDGTIKTEIKIEQFGRLAAQTAKQVIIQRIREAEKDNIYEEYIKKVGEVVNGTVQRVENKNYLISLGNTESILYFYDQIKTERFISKDRIKIYIESVEKTSRGPKIKISRSHPGLLIKLLTLEVPEIQDGTIEVMKAAREAGIRAKIAVKSNNPTVGAIGTCVGHMGGRIQSIIKEFGQEKLDILEWSEIPEKFIGNSLKPAKIAHVAITNKEDKEATVVVENDQLSLAIGKQGINARLSTKLTGWKIDIVSEESYSHQKTSDDPNKAGLSLKEKLMSASKALKEKEESDSNTEAKESGIKVSELAKELKIKTKELIEKATEFEIDIKHNRSLVPEKEATLLREKLAK